MCLMQISSDPEHLNIFLADLKDEDTCTTMYSAQYPGRDSQVQYRVEYRVQYTCTTKYSAQYPGRYR